MGFDFLKDSKHKNQNWLVFVFMKNLRIEIDDSFKDLKTKQH
jgi:hypothetical protein